MGSNIPLIERERREQLYAVGLKQCNACTEPLPLGDFTPRADGYKGLNGTCRNCKNMEHTEYRQRTPDYQAHRQRRWRRRNPETWLAISRRRDVRQRWRETGSVSA